MEIRLRDTPLPMPELEPTPQDKECFINYLTVEPYVEKESGREQECRDLPFTGNVEKLSRVQLDDRKCLINGNAQITTAQSDTSTANSHSPHYHYHHRE